jgi:CHRD domain
MRSRLFTLGLAVALLGVAGCGSSSSTSTPASTGATATTTTPQGGSGTAAAIPARTYSVKLTGAAETPAGAGSGSAVVALSGKKLQACWTFKNLTGFDRPATAAHIHKGAAGVAGPIVIPFGGAYTAKGCTPTSAALITAIEANPKGYYVNVHSMKFPGGAMRSQL